MKNFLIGLLTITILAAGTLLATDRKMEPDSLQTLARNANTAKEHAEVAKQYRLRAESFEATALKHEEEVNRLNRRARTPMDQKWPSMTNHAWARANQLAVQARRAAYECRELAEKHIGLAVEKNLAAE